APAYVVKLKEAAVGLQFLIRINQNKSTKSMGEVIGDRNGKASFSTVRVNFDMRQFNQEHLYNSDSFSFDNDILFEDIAIESVNRFLEVYRSITDRFYITAVTKSMIQEMIIDDSHVDGTTNRHTVSISSG